MYIFLLYSCQEKQKEYKISLKKMELLDLPIENYVNPIKSSVVSFEDKKGNQKIAFFTFKSLENNEVDQEIQIFDLKSKAISDKILIKRSGPNKLNQVDGIQLLKNDKILTNTSITTEFYVADYNLNNVESNNYDPKYLDSLNLLDTKKSVPAFTGHIYKQNYIHIDSLVFIPQVHDLFDFENIKEFNIGIKYNLNSNESSFLKLNYPDENYVTDKLVSFIGQTFNGKEIIYSFAASNQVLKYNPFNEKYEYIETAKSDYMRNFTSLNGTEDSFEQFSYVFATSSHNLSFNYDPYKKVYYRFFYPGIDIDKDDNKLVYYSENFKQFTISVFDKNFNKLYELLMPPNTYDPSSFFINSDGLFLGYSEENLDYNDDYLKFDRFSIINE